MLKLNKESDKEAENIENLNTSHVKVKHTLKTELFKAIQI